MPGRGTLEQETPPIFGLVQRGGTVILHLLANVRQATIKPLILAGVALGSLINTDEYSIYGRLLEWGFGHKAVNPGRGE
jgi:transposase